MTYVTINNIALGHENGNIIGISHNRNSFVDITSDVFDVMALLPAHTQRYLAETTANYIRVCFVAVDCYQRWLTPLATSRATNFAFFFVGVAEYLIDTRS